MEAYARLIKLKPGSNATVAQWAQTMNAVHQQFKIDTWIRGAGAEGRLLLDLQVDA